jgi:hypothetical protein
MRALHLAATALALTAADLFRDPDVLAAAAAEFRRDAA